MKNGMLIITAYGVFKIDKMYNKYVWRLKNEFNEFINVFYSIDEYWTPLTTKNNNNYERND